MILSLLIVVFLLMAAFFATASGALGGLDHVSRARLEQAADAGDTRLRLVMDNPTTSRAVLDFFGDACHVGVASSAAILLPGLCPKWDGDLLVGVALLASFLLLLLVAEIPPRVLAARHTEQVIRALSMPLFLAVRFIGPLRRGIDRVLPDRPSRMAQSISAQPTAAIDEQEFRTLLDESTEAGVVEKHAQALIHNVLDFGDRRVSELMTPLGRVFSLSDETTSTRAAELAAENKYSRIPVYRKSPKQITGVLHAKDLLPIRWSVASSKALKVLMRRPLYVVPQMRAQALLESFRRQRLHMAVVVDERGAALGVCTMEDLLEELVGPITDVALERKGDEGPQR